MSELMDNPDYTVTFPQPINELAKALAKAQEQIRGAKATAYNPFFKSKYADIGDVWDSVRAALTIYGLSVAQVGVIENGVCVLKTILLHTSGQSIESIIPIVCKPGDAQSFGSGLSYARRYALAAITGTYDTGDDDDANKAVGNNSDRQQDPQANVYKPAEVKNHAPGAPPKSYAGPAGDWVMPFGMDKGKKLKDIDPASVKSTIQWAKNKDKVKFKDVIESCEKFLEMGARSAEDDIPPGPPIEAYQNDEIPF